MTEFRMLIIFADGEAFFDAMSGWTLEHALDRARWNWDDARYIIPAV